jgi:amino acid permease
MVAGVAWILAFGGFAVLYGRLLLRLPLQSGSEGMGWLEFAAAFAAFFLTHSCRCARRCARAVAAGPRADAAFTLAYSALSLAVLAG